MKQTHVLIADDHPMYRKGLRSAVESNPDFVFVGDADAGQEAVAMTVELQPDVVLMDIQMPGMNGIDATREIQRLAPHVRVLMLTMHEDNDSLFSALRVGACGYIQKGADEREIVRAIGAAARGELHFSPAIAARVLEYFRNLSTIMRSISLKTFPELTPRENEILEMMAQGLGNAEIVKRLVLSDHTVRNHVSNIYDKLQVTDRTQAVIRARDAGLGGDHTAWQKDSR